ncbi:Transitional endoplasmic reticulum ATPase TER94 [Gryllus bimaculatus]|nr:Transitional endoplasmic reticulum ATPase TER94 [Gryllus bimaculatus]
MVYFKDNTEAQTLLNVLQFTTRILYPKYPQIIFPLLSKLYIIYQYRKRKMASHIIRVVPQEIVTKLINTYYGNSHTTDPCSCVLIPDSTLKLLGVLNGSWVKMRIFCNEYVKDGHDKQAGSQMKQNAIIVQVIALEDLEDMYAIVGDVMNHNLKNLQNLDVAKELCAIFASIVTKSTISETYSTSFVPQTAETAKIALVQSSNDIESEVLNDILKMHFRIPRYLTKGFIYSIEIKQYLSLLNFSESTPKSDPLFFNVVDLSGPDTVEIPSNSVVCGYFVYKEVSTLHQVTNKHCYLPLKSSCVANTSKTVTAKNYKSFILDICPRGLFEYYEQLFAQLHPFLVKHQALEINPMFLLFGPQGVGKREIVKHVASSIGVNVLSVNCSHMHSSTTGYSEGKLKLVLSKVKKCSPCILFFRNLEAMFKDKDGEDDQRIMSTFQEEITNLFNYTRETSKYPVFIIATCDTIKDSCSSLPAAVARTFLNVLHVTVPNESQRASMLTWLLKKDNIKLDTELSVQQLAAQTSGFLFADIVALLSNALSNRYKQLRSTSLSKSENCEISRRKIFLLKEDVDEALETMHAAYADAIGAPRIPTVSWKDVGGLSALKEEILRTINMPLRHPELTASGLRRSGLLLYGPPGTGKTLLAKAVATECSLNFLSVKGPELLNMYVGQSEENVREVFQRARSSAPCIIFFDELDSLAPNRGRNGDSGGVMDRVVSQLLAEMDGLQKSTQLFVIGATNRPDLIDPALLRPGRFDKLLYVGVCEDKDSLLSVMVALTRKFHLKADVNLKTVVDRLPPNLTGADLYSLCSNAWMNAVKMHIKAHKEENIPIPKQVEVSHANFEDALSSIKPSVSPDDLQYFKTVHQQIAAH